MIRRQLGEESAADVPDRDKLCEWVKDDHEVNRGFRRGMGGVRNMVTCWNWCCATITTR